MIHHYHHMLPLRLNGGQEHVPAIHTNTTVMHFYAMIFVSVKSSRQIRIVADKIEIVSVQSVHKTEGWRWRERRGREQSVCVCVCVCVCERERERQTRGGRERLGGTWHVCWEMGEG